MKPRYKVTGCARFFVFAIIFVPIVFFGATYFRGENGIQIIKDYYHKVTSPFSSGDTKPSPSTKQTTTSNGCDEIEEQLLESEKENRQLKSKIRDLEKENSDLKARSTQPK